MSKPIIPIREFPIDKMKLNTRTIMVGDSGFGKSVLLKHIMKVHAHQFPVIKVVAGSEEVDPFYSQMIPPLYIHDEYSNEIITNVEKRQTLARKNPNINPRLMLILDDCSDDNKYFSQPPFQRLLKYGRHWDVMFFLLLQYAVDIPAKLRKCLSYIFIFREDILKNKEKIYENFFSRIPKPRFYDFLDLITEAKFTCLVIDKTDQNKRAEEQIFFYKGPEEADFEMGCPEYRQWADARYDPNFAQNF